MSWTLAQRRRVSAGLIVGSLATLLLLAAHGGGGQPGQPLIEVLRSEAVNQYRDGAIHGGLIAVLWLLIVSFVRFSQGMGFDRVRVVAGLVSFCMGCLFLMASMTLDGLVVPAIAARFLQVGQSVDLVGAKTLLIFCGSAIQILMPMGLLFQALAMVCWSAAIAGVASGGQSLWVGWFGILAGSLHILATFLLPHAGPHLIFAGMGLLSLWYLAIAGLIASPRGETMSLQAFS